jgi:hypothetical protein
MTPLDVKCPFCGAEAGQSCVDKTGAPYPPHRGRVIAAQTLQDASSLEAANAVARARRPVATPMTRPTREKAARAQAATTLDETPTIALAVMCPNCDAEIGQACSTPSGLCRIRKQIALGHGADV